jgi:acyl-CoA synthetase (AMP-forming)/AMP-acid ligase II
MATRGERSVTYREAADGVHRYSRALAAAGLRRGDRLVWWGSTSLELLPLFFATAAVGATFTPMNPAFTDDEVRPVLDLVEPRLVVTDDSHAGDLSLADLVTSNVAGLMQAIARRRATNFYALPPVWRRILELDLSRFDLSSLRLANTGTSATPLSLLESIHEALPHTTTTIAYGSTEAGAVSTLAFGDIHRKPGSVGRPAEDVEIRIDDDGTLWVRSPTIFSGYFRNPEATAETLVDGWYRTGELVEVDDDGYLSIVGRSTEMIRTGGETVAPAEVDSAIVDHPALADVAVAGVVDADWGEIVTAFVVLRPGASLTLEELQEHCADRLTRFKMPRRLVVLDEIPRTGATRQVQRRLLARLA